MASSDEKFTFVSDVFTFVINDLVVDSISSVIVSITPLLHTTMGVFFGLYSVWLASKWIFDKADFPLLDGIKTLGLLSIVTFFAFSSGAYVNDIVPIVLEAGDDLAALVTSSQNTPEALDALITTIYKAIWQIWDEADLDWFSGTIFLSFFNIALILIGAIPFIITSFGILLTAKVMVALLLSTGTIYICFAFFQQTRHWFQQWINMCLNYTLIAFLFPVAFNMQMLALDKFIYTDGQLDISYSAAFKLMIILLAFLAISVQIPVMASSLSGGVGINGMSGSFSSMAGGLKSILSPLKSPAIMAGKGAGKLGGKAVEAYKNRGNGMKAG